MLYYAAGLKKAIRIILICCVHASFGNKFIAGVDMYVLVSSSMPKKAIHALSYTGKKIDAAMVFKGLIDGNVGKTNHYFKTLVKQTGWGAILHPELFEKFGVEYGPCFILAEIDIAEKITRHDKICGNVNFDYALSEFASKGDMQVEAKVLLEKLRRQDDRNFT